MSSKVDAAEARSRIDELQAGIDEYLQDEFLSDLQNEQAALHSALNEWVLAKGEYEDDNWKATRVVATTVSWNMQKLMPLLPKSMVLKVCNLVIDRDKLDAAVAAKKINAKLIAPAMEQTEKKPFVRWTKKDNSGAKKQGEADALADALS